jgi:gas vesicle protein
VWGCIPELSKGCQDMTNASSTYLSILIGAIIGALVSWWVYNRQKKTTEKQDFTLARIKELDESNERMLERLQESEKRNDSTLNAVLELNKKIEYMIERQDKMHKSIQNNKRSSTCNNINNKTTTATETDANGSPG